MTERLIEPQILVERLNQPNLRVYDCAVIPKPVEGGGYDPESGLKSYQAAHIPGAGFIDLTQAFSDLSTGLTLSLPKADVLSAAVENVGIGNDHEVVLYSSGHMMWAARVWWLLHHLGHPDVKLLNGGLEAWRDAGFEVASGGNNYTATKFSPLVNHDAFVDLKGMENMPANVCTVNVLPPDLYTGEGDIHFGRRGHIPGSRHLFHGELMNGNSFRPVEELRSALQAKGLLEADRVVTYCGNGIAASIESFACLLCGQDNVAVYDGSMSEWVRSGNPLKTGMDP